MRSKFEILMLGYAWVRKYSQFNTRDHSILEKLMLEATLMIGTGDIGQKIKRSISANLHLTHFPFTLFEDSY